MLSGKPLLDTIIFPETLLIKISMPLEAYICVSENSKDLYSIDKESNYYYSGGWHIKGVYSLIIGFIFSASTIWNTNLMFLQSYAWIIGAFVAWITYYLLAKK